MKYILQVGQDLSVLVDDIDMRVGEEGEEGGHGPGGGGDEAAAAMAARIAAIRSRVDI